MKNETINGAPIHWAAEMHAQEYRDGKLSRREFLARATSLGVTAAAAYGMIGLESPAYAAGEMKHGPIALIDDAVPIIVIAPSGRLYEKTVSNMQEVIARKGQVYFFTDIEGAKTDGEECQPDLERDDAQQRIEDVVASGHPREQLDRGHVREGEEEQDRAPPPTTCVEMAEADRQQAQQQRDPGAAGFEDAIAHGTS